MAFPKDKKAPLGASFWQNLVPEILSAAGRPEASICVILRPDGIMRGLEERHMGRVKPPVSVLSFPASFIGPHSEKDELYLGEVFLNTGYLREASLYDALHLLIHGTLHLLGYHHDGIRDNIVMTREEKRILDLFFPSSIPDKKHPDGFSAKSAGSSASRRSNKFKNHELPFSNRIGHRHSHG